MNPQLIVTGARTSSEYCYLFSHVHLTVGKVIVGILNQKIYSYMGKIPTWQSISYWSRIRRKQNPHNFQKEKTSVGDLWHFGAEPDLWLTGRIRLLSSVTSRMQAHYLQSLTYCFKEKFCVKILFCKHYFSLLNTFMRKKKDPDPYLWLTDPYPGGTKNMRILRIRIPNIRKKPYIIRQSQCVHLFVSLPIQRSLQ